MANGPQSKTHRERSQPASRARLGLLEKRSDYLQRARDYHSKQDRLKALQVRAQYKNPNEFAFGMVKSVVAADGTHRDGSEKRALPTEVVRMMKSQDLSYVRLMKKVNEGKLKRLLSPEDSNVAQHVKFYDSEDEHCILENPERVCTHSALQRQSLTPEERAEIKIRKERVSKLGIAEKELENQKLLMGSGKRRKVAVDDNGVSIFKWAPIRKK